MNRAQFETRAAKILVDGSNTRGTSRGNERCVPNEAKNETLNSDKIQSQRTPNKNRPLCGNAQPHYLKDEESHQR